MKAFIRRSRSAFAGKRRTMRRHKAAPAAADDDDDDDEAPSRLLAASPICGLPFRLIASCLLFFSPPARRRR